MLLVVDGLLFVAIFASAAASASAPTSPSCEGTARRLPEPSPRQRAGAAAPEPPTAQALRVPSGPVGGNRSTGFLDLHSPEDSRRFREMSAI